MILFYFYSIFFEFSPIQCRNRYKAAKAKYEQQFQYEISQLLTQQSSGYEVARLNRYL